MISEMFPFGVVLILSASVISFLLGLALGLWMIFSAERFPMGDENED